MIPLGLKSWVETIQKIFKGVIYEIISPLEVVVARCIYTKTNWLPASGELSTQNYKQEDICLGVFSVFLCFLINHN